MSILTYMLRDNDISSTPDMIFLELYNAIAYTAVLIFLLPSLNVYSLLG
jgi:hypothetical protein